MPKFTVLRRVDAFVDYEAEVEASSPEAAAALANRAEERFSWKEAGVAEFDARFFVTLNEDGDEIEGTQRGDF